MSKEELSKFLDEVRSNKKVQNKILEENPETLEDLAKVSGGIATTLGYKFSDEELLACYKGRVDEVLQNSNAATAAVKASDGESDSIRTTIKRGCGAVQVLLDDNFD